MLSFFLAVMCAVSEAVFVQDRLGHYLGLDRYAFGCCYCVIEGDDFAGIEQEVLAEAQP